MTKLFKTLSVLALGLAALACTKTEEPQLSISEKSITFDASVSLEKTVKVTSNVAWSISCDADWLSFTPSSGEGSASVTVKVEENTKVQERTANVKVTAGAISGTITVTQLGITPAIEVNPTSAEFQADGGDIMITVTANVDWTVTVPEADKDWLSADNVDNGLMLTATPNLKLDPRTSEVVVKGEDKTVKIPVSQLGSAPALVCQPTSFEPVANTGADLQLTVLANTEWKLSIPEEATWIEADTAGGEGGPDAVTVTFTVAPNDTDLRGRGTTVTLDLVQFPGTYTLSLDINQLPADPSGKTDYVALMAVYNAADGANWKESRRWDLEQTMDKWPGVKLNEDGRVIELSITNGTVTSVEWELPVEIADLTELATFQAVGSKVIGTFPEFLYGMTKLTVLRLNSNPKLTGTISAKIAQLSELKELFINGTGISGTIPAQIGQLKKLNNFNFAQSGISGALPEELAQCEGLVTFVGYESQLTSIPDNFDQWPAVKTFMLYGCKNLECPLPASLGNNKTVTSIQLKNGNFTGNIPESYANLPVTCKQLFLNGNKLQGVVPAAVQNHTNWKNDQWKRATNILPQQEGYGLMEKDGSGGQDLDDPTDEDPWN